jgi:hypothetical protein
VSTDDADSIRLVVDLDARASAPSGHITDERGVMCAFWGWLELMDGVQRALRRVASPERPEGAEDATRTP